MIKAILEYFNKLWYNLCRIEGRVRSMNNVYSANDIATFILCWFASRDKNITNLKLQKLLYFCEAYYMNLTGKSQLFDDNFNALTYGPVALNVYNRYKSFLNHPIVINQDECRDIDNPDVKQSVEKTCEFFGNFSSSYLVALTHLKNSPWNKVWHKNGETSNYGKDGIISKEETKSWFRKEFLDESE